MSRTGTAATTAALTAFGAALGLGGAVAWRFMTALIPPQPVELPPSEPAEQGAQSIVHLYISPAHDPPTAGYPMAVVMPVVCALLAVIVTVLVVRQRWVLARDGIARSQPLTAALGLLGLGCGVVVAAVGWLYPRQLFVPGPEGSRRYGHFSPDPAYPHLGSALATFPVVGLLLGIAASVVLGITGWRLVQRTP